MAVFKHGVFKQTVKLNDFTATADKVTILAEVRKRNDASLEFSGAEADALLEALATARGKRVVV